MIYKPELTQYIQQRKHWSKGVLMIDQMSKLQVMYKTWILLKMTSRKKTRNNTTKWYSAVNKRNGKIYNKNPSAQLMLMYTDLLKGSKKELYKGLNTQYTYTQAHTYIHTPTHIHKYTHTHTLKHTPTHASLLTPQTMENINRKLILLQ